MKFKKLISTISSIYESAAGEHTFGGGLYIGDPQGKLGPSPVTDKGTFNLNKSHQLDAINAMLYGFSCKEYIDPDSVLAVIKQKLNLFGLDFAAPTMTLNDGMTSFELVQYGSPQLGVYGQNPYDDVNKTGFKQGDGIKEKLGHSLALTVNVQKQPNHLRKVMFLIAPIETSSYNVDAGPMDCGCQH